MAREKWGVVANIKELKSGYLSQVVHKITELAIKHNALIILENLNFGFKNSRVKFEKQVYQKFEHALLTKLNLVIRKDEVKDIAPGGKYNGLQLTSKLKSFQSLGVQSGVLLYIPAWKTSKIDPTTGWTSEIRAKYKTVTAAQALVNTFESIKYNTIEKHYEFDVDYSKFGGKNLGRTKWVICSCGDRIETKKDYKTGGVQTHVVNLTKSFNALFQEYKIDNHCTGQDIKAQIAMQVERNFFEEFLRLFRLTTQLRNSDPKTGDDYIISPVKNHKGIFFDSRYASQDEPQDADANGAYNIARKGLMVAKQIAVGNKPDTKNETYLKFIQQETFPSNKQ